MKIDGQRAHLGFSDLCADERSRGKYRPAARRGSNVRSRPDSRAGRRSIAGPDTARCRCEIPTIPRYGSSARSPGSDRSSSQNRSPEADRRTICRGRKPAPGNHGRQERSNRGPDPRGRDRRCSKRRPRNQRSHRANARYPPPSDRAAGYSFGPYQHGRAAPSERQKNPACPRAQRSVARQNRRTNDPRPGKPPPPANRSRRCNK